MDYALKNGCQEAKVNLYSGSNTSFELRDAKMDRLQQASENGLTIFLYVDGRYGTYSTNRLDKKELETFITNGIESTRYLAKDEARVLPDASRYSLSAEVAIKGEGEARPSAGWYESSLYFDKLVKGDIGRKALERALRKVGQKKVKSGKYTMVVDPLNAGQLLGPLISALYGSALQQRNSFLLNKLNEKVVADKMTLMDEPHLVQASGARYFDSEGVATERRAVFKNGILNTYFIDTYNAKKMGTASTVNSPSILVLQTGKNDLDGLVAEVDKGILITGFNGGNCNSSTGDFSYGIEGFLIENGKLTQPVSEMNVTGNMLALWSSLVETGNDPRLSSSWRIPSLVFEGVDFSGL